MEKAGGGVYRVRKQLTSERSTREMRIINEALAIFDEEGPNIEKVLT